MPFGMTGSRERIESNNEVQMKDGTREFEIVDAWAYNVVEVDKTSQRTGAQYTTRDYTAEPSNEQDCQLKLRLVKRPDIVLEDRLRLYIGKKSKFAQLLKGLIGVEPGDDLIAYLLPNGHPTGEPLTADQVKAISKRLRDDIVGKRVLATTTYRESGDRGFTRIKGYTQLPEEVDDLEDIPQQQPRAQEARQAGNGSGGPGGDGYRWEEEDEIPF